MTSKPVKFGLFDLSAKIVDEELPGLMAKLDSNPKLLSDILDAMRKGLLDGVAAEMGLLCRSGHLHGTIEGRTFCDEMARPAT